MSENNDRKIVSEGGNSTGDLFNELIKSIVEKQNPKVAVAVNNADEQILVQNWLASKHSQDFLKLAQKGKYTSIGVVHRIDNTYGQINVGVINKWGLFGFIYEKGAKRFKDAPNGFSIGDIVLEKLDGTDILSAKPLELSKEMKLKVIEKIRSDHHKIEGSL
jgi:hypothetical protein